MAASSNVLIRIYRFYRDGFREMSALGRTLWIVILIKLFIIFFVLKLFFFPDAMRHLETEQQKSEYVMDQLLNINR